MKKWKSEPYEEGLRSACTLWCSLKPMEGLQGRTLPALLCSAEDDHSQGREIGMSFRVQWEEGQCLRGLEGAADWRRETEVGRHSAILRPHPVPEISLMRAEPQVLWPKLWQPQSKAISQGSSHHSCERVIKRFSRIINSRILCIWQNAPGDSLKRLPLSSITQFSQPSHSPLNSHPTEGDGHFQSEPRSTNGQGMPQL